MLKSVVNNTKGHMTLGQLSNLIKNLKKKRFISAYSFVIYYMGKDK